MAIQPPEARDVRDLLSDAIAERRRRRLSEILRSLPPREAADMLDAMSPAELAAAVTLLGGEQLADILENLDAADAARLLLKLSRAQAADVLEEMDPDDAADVVGELEPAEARAILVEMEAPEAEEIRELLAYPPESAAGLMTREVVTVSPDLTAEQALAAIRRVAREAETIYYVYVTDAAGTLLGVLSLRDLVLAPPATPIGQLTRREVVKVRADADREVAARLLADRGLLAIPVVDAGGRLLGIITADDAADVLEEEATEDMYHMAGIGVRERATSPALESARRRVPWLAFNMAWSLASAFVVSRFTGTIEAVAVLAVFMPVIAGQAGNAGIQTATIVIRSLALGDVRPRDTLGVLLREWGVGAIKGGTFGVLLALIAWLWFGNPVLGLVAGVSLFLNIALVASTTGVLLPMGLARLGLDPATIAGVFDTMLSDLMGNLIYLGLATLLIHWLV